MTTRKALLVGINAYAVKPLCGCVNDVTQIRDLLLTFYGFNAGDIRLLLDHEATRNSIEVGLEWLAQGGDTDDAVRVFQFSGHGKSVADLDGDESDGRDECLVPVDYPAADLLSDDVLRGLYDRFPPAGNITLVMDSCFSGSVDKYPDQAIVGRFLPITFEEQERIDHAARQFKQTQRTLVYDEIRKLRDVGASDDECRERAAILIEAFEKKRFGNAAERPATVHMAASQDWQEAAETWIGGDRHGVFSYYLAETITEANGQISYGDLIQRVQRKLNLNGYTHTPRLACQVDREARLAFQPFR